MDLNEIQAFAVGDRVAHSDERAAGIVGTVESLDDPADMGDVLVSWDSPLPWLGERYGARGWHGAGFLRPAPVSDGETVERVPLEGGACRTGRPCRHSIFHGAFTLGRGDACDGREERTTREIVETVERWAGGRFDLSDHGDALANGYRDGRAGDAWRLVRLLQDCTAYSREAVADALTG